jgi:predicted ribonuclease toxin of YeeF-YezG toxin-antitoxin module
MVTEPELAKQTWQQLAGLTPETIKKLIVDAAESKVDIYAKGGVIARHEAGADVVTVVVATSVAYKLLKDGHELVKKSGKKGKEMAEETTELVGKYDWNLVRKYFQHIQDVTGRAVPQKQIDRLKDALRVKEYKKLSDIEIARHRADFETRKNQIIKEWENQTGQEWPKYTESVFSKKGVELRKPGDLYDVHHIINNKFGGDNEWWNMHPAKFPDEHQGGIHGAGSPSRELFK